MKHVQAHLVLMILVLVAAAAAPAAVLPIEQERSIQGSAYAEDADGFDDGWESMTAPDFGPFSEGVGVTISLAGALASGSATQNSEIAAEGFLAHGSAAANAEGYDDFSFGDASGDSEFLVVFQITEATEYHLTGFVEGYDDGAAYLDFEGPDGWIHGEGAYGNQNIPVDESGILAPGEYTFWASASAFTYGDFYYYGYGSAAYELQLSFSTATAAPIGDGRDAILAVHPNPMTSQTVVSYTLPSARPRTIDVFDIRGHRVRSLVTGGAAVGNVIWDGRGDDGRALAQGNYFLRLHGEPFRRPQKVMLVR